jgi:hypothetical protein
VVLAAVKFASDVAAYALVRRVVYLRRRPVASYVAGDERVGRVEYSRRIPVASCVAGGVLMLSPWRKHCVLRHL